MAVLLAFALSGWRHQQADKRALARLDATETFPADTAPAPTVGGNDTFLNPTVSVRAPVTRPFRILVVGDSIAHGYWASDPNAAFPAVLAREIAKRTRDTLQVIATPGVKASYYAQTSFPAADLVVVELGTNDTNGYSNTETPIAQFDRTYRTLIRHVRSASPHAALICLNVWRSPTYTAAGNPPVSEYDHTIANDCAGGLPLDIGSLYVQGGLRSSRDDFHPNDAGHTAIAQEIEAALHFAS